jgi:hypothetical protein
MSFVNELDNIPRASNSLHVPKNSRTKIATHGQLKDKPTMPPMNFFTGIQRVKPTSSFTTTNLFNVGQSIDFQCSWAGFVEQVRIQMDLEINPAAANPVSINSNYLLNRVEIYTSDNNIAQTFYADQIFLRRIVWNQDKSEFENASQRIVNYGPSGNIAAATKFSVEIEIPNMLSDVQFKGGVPNNKVLFRVWFDLLGVVSGAITDLWCNLCDLIFYTQQLDPMVEQKEICMKKQEKLQYRVLDPIRCATLTIPNATANQNYDVLLTGLNGLSSMIFFVVRTSPISSANIQSYVSGLKYELYDQNSQLLATTIDDNKNRYIIGQKFGGDILKQSQGAGIYLLPFAVDISAAMKGVNSGFYAGSTREILKIYFPTGFVQANVVVDVYSYNYAVLESDKGILKYYK